MTGKAVVGYSGDSAGLEEVLRVGRARREVGKASEVGEEDFRACTGSFEHTVGSIAQRFEGLGEAKAGEGLLSSPSAPAAGSATLARFDSSNRISCVLQAMRRAKWSGNPIAAVCGTTVMLPAPPGPAAATATVARSMFTNGSRCVIMRHAVSAAMNTGAGVSPQASSTRAHNLRSARNFAVVRN